MTLEIGGKDYQIEYTFEASMYNECTEQIIDFMTNSVMMSEKEQSEENIKEMLKGMTTIPSLTLTMFYAGLLEHHGVDGDGSVPDKIIAKQLMKQYMKEHQGQIGDNAYDILNMLLGQMGADGFFKQIGLEQMMKTEDNETPKTPRPNRTTRRATAK